MSRPSRPPDTPAATPTAHTRRWRRALIWLMLLAAMGAVLGAVHTGRIVVPPRWNPFAPLDVAETPNLLTPWKLRHARSDPQRCLATLARSGLRFDTLPDRRTGEGCGFENAVRLSAGQGVQLSSATALSCRAALSFALWERHGLQNAAREHLGQRVTRVEHMGSYSCRDINTGDGRDTGRRSRHATADALDISGFTLADGRRISVLRDSPQLWDDDAALQRSATVRFLHAAHVGACRSFDGTLGPGYNRAHRDHFHLEVGGWPLCR
ncbi:MAG: extensin [Comamonadaceae bacterium]|nr:MAG: extensin [Comamonadaceae bacterium]